MYWLFLPKSKEIGWVGVQRIAHVYFDMIANPTIWVVMPQRVVKLVVATSS